MMLDFYQHIPELINPIAFSVGSFDVRWYSVSYIVGFLVTYIVLNKSVRHADLKIDLQISTFKFKIFNKYFDFNNSNVILDFLLLNFFAALIGGRLGYILFYELPYFPVQNLSIISPFKQEKFVGFYGMSYHGALLAILLASFIFLKIKKINFFVWADMVAPVAALGYFFGRLGNFLNGELLGRITNSKLGMYFLADPHNLRHPSQIYEALGEGLILYVLLWKWKRKKSPEGTIFCLYLIAYSAIRFVLEFLREPDSQIGFVIGKVTLGQTFSFLMFAVGALLLAKIKSKSDLVNKR